MKLISVHSVVLRVNQPVPDAFTTHRGLCWRIPRRDSWRRILSLSLCCFLFFSPILSSFFREVCQCQIYSASLFVRSPKIVRRLWMSSVQAFWPRSGKLIISKKETCTKALMCIFLYCDFVTHVSSYIYVCIVCVESSIELYLIVLYFYCVNLPSSMIASPINNFYDKLWLLILRFKFQLLELIFYTCFLEDFTEYLNVLGAWKLWK